MSKVFTIRFLGINLTKDVKDQYSKNIKTLKEETEEDTRQWKDLLCSWVGRINIVKIAKLLTVIYRFNTFLIKILIIFSCVQENNPKMYMKHKKNSLPQ